ncbi:MAG TPA: LuxR C-terminal-related transcriptional regulator [Microbacteriaceae bacterium]|nr:LuxR C-terminal-related transcriptional regulator [Microbacteriaceae bacterium]
MIDVEDNKKNDPHVSPVVYRRKKAHDLVATAKKQNGMTLLVDGHSGMGKTFFLREITDFAGNNSGDNHWDTIFVRADEIENGEPYSFIERLIAGSSFDDWTFGPTDNTTPIEIARECVKRLTTETATTGKVIVIDDAQWIDKESQLALRYIIPRISRRNIMVVFGVRTPHKTDSFGEYLLKIVSETPQDGHCNIAPLSLQEIAAYALDRLKVGISTNTSQQIYDETGGSFLKVDSIIGSLTEEQIAQMHVSWDSLTPLVIPDNDPLLFTFKQLSEKAQKTAEIVCLAGHELSLDELNQVAAKLGESVEVQEPLEAGVIIKSGFGATVMARHALLGQAIRATVNQSRTRSVHHALSEVTKGYRKLHHTLLGADEWNKELYGIVDDFVSTVAEKGNYSLASDVLRASLKITSDVAARTFLLESITLIHLRAKTGYMILDLLPELETLPDNIFHDFMKIVVAAHQFGEELPMERVQKLLMAKAETPEDKTIVAFFAFMVVILTMRSKKLESLPSLIAHARALINDAPGSSDELKDQRLAWMIDKEGHLLVLDCYLVVQNQMLARMDLVAGATPKLTKRIHELPDGPLKVDACVAVAGAELAIGNAFQGKKLAELGVNLLEKVSEPWAASTARLILADSLILFGEYKEAMELIELTEELSYSSLDVETRSTWAALRVFIGAVTGQGNVSSYLELSKRQVTLLWEGYGTDRPIIAECELARTQNDYERMLEISLTPWANKIVNTRHGLLTYRAHALISLNKLSEARSLLEQLASWRGTKWQEYWGSLDWLRARLARHQGDTENAKWFYEAAITEKEFPLHYSLTLADYGEFLIEQQENKLGSEKLAESIKILDEIDAHAYLHKIKETYHALPGKQLAGSNKEALLAGLTPREKQIVEQLAKGRSNSQIAETLVVSVTTVRSHVSNILRKLNLTSRGEVTKLFR